MGLGEDVYIWSCENQVGAQPVCASQDPCADGTFMCDTTPAAQTAAFPRTLDTGADEAYCAALVDVEGAAKAAGAWAAVDNGGCGDRLRVVCSLDRHVGVSCEDVNECDILNGGCSHGRLRHSVTVLIQTCSKIHTITAVF